MARMWTDYLWFDSLGHGDVWSEILVYKIVLSIIFIVLFFLLLYSNLVIADRLAPGTRPPGPEEELIRHYHDAIGNRRRLVSLVVAGLFALIVGGSTGGEWQKAMLFFNSVEFGMDDPQFGKDIGFYVFRLPFIQFLISWVFRAFIIVAVITAIAHYVNGGIRVQTTGQRVTPQVKVHLSVLLALIALTRAVGYFFDRFGLNFSTRGPVDGASFTDVTAQLPALNLLLLISVLSAILLVINIWQRGWVLPVTAVGLWMIVAIIMGAIYPAIIQRFRVEPEESKKEAVYIERNIDATRHALGLDNVITREFTPDIEITVQELADNPSVRNIRLLDPDIVPNAFQVEQSERTFYTFNSEVDVDRYEIGGKTTEVVIGARQLNVADVPQQSWEGSHIQYTHGYGVAVAPVNSVTTQGSPDFIVGDVPVVASPDFEPEPTPDLYRREPHRLRHRRGLDPRGGLHRGQRDRSLRLRRRGRSEHRRLLPPSGVCPALRRHQPPDLRFRGQRLSDHLQSRSAPPGAEFGPVLGVGHRSLSGDLQREGDVRHGRLHHQRPLSLRPEPRRERPVAKQRAAQEVQLRPQLGESGGRYL